MPEPATRPGTLTVCLLPVLAGARGMGRCCIHSWNVAHALQALPRCSLPAARLFGAALLALAGSRLFRNRAHVFSREASGRAVYRSCCVCRDAA